MTKLISKTTNHTALTLSQFHTTFEACVNALPRFKSQPLLVIKEDPISSLHILVHEKFNLKNAIRLEKRDVELANQDQHYLYHLLAVVLNSVKSA